MLAREAFEASLEIENRDGSPLANISVQLGFRTEGAAEGEEFFGVRALALRGLTAVDGSGVLPVQSTGSATWILIPTLNAAPNGPTR